MKWYLTVMKKYAVFSGRARRKEYWMYFLFCIIFLLVAAILDNVLGTTFKFQVMGTTADLHYGYIYLVYALATFIPGLAVGVRRLHDVGKSGWLYALPLIAIPIMVLAAFAHMFIIAIIGDLLVIGLGIWIFILTVTDSTPGDNKYGPNPKGVSASGEQAVQQ